MVKERRKVRTGEVIGNKMDKTIIVAVRWRQRHPIYRKAVQHISKFYAHDAENTCNLGDLVRIEETRPISRLKHWRVLDIVERREIAEVKPEELDREVLAETQAQPIAVEDETPQEQEPIEDIPSGEEKTE